MNMIMCTPSARRTALGLCPLRTTRSARRENGKGDVGVRRRREVHGLLGLGYAAARAPRTYSYTALSTVTTDVRKPRDTRLTERLYAYGVL